MLQRWPVYGLFDCSEYVWTIQYGPDSILVLFSGQWTVMMCVRSVMCVHGESESCLYCLLVFQLDCLVLLGEEEWIGEEGRLQ